MADTPLILDRFQFSVAVDQTKDEYAQAIENGMEPHEAWEAVRENPDPSITDPS
jgi:hypothetical protein